MKTLTFLAAAGLAIAMTSTPCFAEDAASPAREQLLSLQTIHVGTNGSVVQLSTIKHADGSTCRQTVTGVEVIGTGTTSITLADQCIAADSKLLWVQNIQLEEAPELPIQLSAVRRADGVTCKQIISNVDRSPTGVAVHIANQCIAAETASPAVSKPAAT